MKRVARVFKALSDETRIRIFNLLTRRDCCVCEVMEALAISQTRASRNLQILHDAGLLRHWKAGLWSHYGIDENQNGLQTRELVRGIQRALEEDPQALEDIERLDVMGQAGERCGTSYSSLVDRDDV